MNVMQPTLSTPRLLLRPYSAADAPAACRLAGDVRIADTTVSIPHPYSQEAAEAWIATHAKGFEQKTEMIFAVETKSDHQLTGTVSLLNISGAHARAELGYWISVENWGKGFCTEAVLRLIQFASEELGITRFTSLCFARNPSSARVMEKAGLKREGYLVQHMFKNGCCEDLLLYGLALPGRQEYQQQ
ncbi:MAG: GNAT family N-acetyltransferase [Chlorobium sp.]